MPRFLFLITLLFCLIKIGQAQEPVFRNFNVEDGLPSSEVYHCIQDSKGFMWFSTDRGVARYDGYEFEVFTTDDGLADNVIFELYEDYKGRIWFVSYSLNLSYFENDSIKHYKYNNLIQKVRNSLGTESSFVVDSLDNIYIGTESSGSMSISSQGVIDYDNEPFLTHLIKILKIQQHFFYYKIRSQVKDVSVFSSDTIRYSVIYNNNMVNDIVSKASIGPSNIEISTFQNECNFLSFSGSIYQLTQSANLQLFYKTHLRIISLLEKKDFLWAGAYKHGINIINKKSKEIEQQFLNGLSISSIWNSNKGYWITTLEKGVFYTPNLLNFTLPTDLSVEQNHITAITGNGKDEVVIANGSNEILLFKDNIKLLYRNKVPSIYFSEISHIMYDNKQQAYIVSCGGVFSYKNDRFEILPYLGPRDMILKKNDTIITCQDKVVTWTKDNQKKHGDIGCQCIEKMKDSKILIGGLNGLYEFKEDSIIFIGNSSDLLNSRIIDIKDHPDVGAVIGTRGNGVVFIKGNEVFNITTKDGLVSNQINSLHVDYKNDIWVATNKGVSVIQEINTKRIKNITVEHGLLSNEVTSIYISQGKAWIGTKKGVNIIDLELLDQINDPSPVLIKSINTNDKILKLNSLIKPVVLDYKASFIEIKFTALNFRSQGNINYKYRLEGLNNSWIETKSNIIQIPSIPSGEYTFQIIAENEDGVWSSSPTEIEFVVSFPFWQTWWFYLLSFLFITVIISSFYILRLRRINERNKLNDEIRNYRHQAFSSQMNPHFIFNSLNSIQSFIVKNDRKESNRYLAKFAKLMRLILANSQSSEVMIADELLALELYLELESIRFKPKLKYSILVDPEIDSQNTLIPTLIIQPFVENSIWHGIMHKEGEGLVKIELKKEENRIICFIEDNGIGRKEAALLNTKKSHKSLSTGITEKRLQLLATENKIKYDLKIIDLKDKNQISLGTLVKFSIPNKGNTKENND